MFKQLGTATAMLLALTILTGGLYPLFVTGVAQVAFPRQANGSLVGKEGEPAGSELIGQAFAGAGYFWGRLSATAPVPYNGAASSGSNFGPLHPGLKDAAAARIAALRAAGSPVENVPVDLVTASASGLDPHISPAAAYFQVPRIAGSRRMTHADVRDLIGQFTEGRQHGVLGEPRVNVLHLNIALDEQRKND